MYAARSIYALLIAAILSAVSLRALAQEPSGREAIEQYAVAAGVYSQSRWAEAVEEFQAFLNQHPDDVNVADATFFLGEAHVQLGHYAEARSAFEKLLKIDPQHRFASQARFRVGEAAFLAGDLAQASTALERFRKSSPFDPLLAYALPYLGDIALDNSDHRQAETHYGEALDRFADGPLAEHCRFGLGRALEAAGDAEQALRFYELLAIDKQTDLADDAQLRIGVLRYEAGEYGLAEVALSRLLDEFAESNLATPARYWMGMAQIAQQHWSDAAETLRAAAPEDENHPLAAAIRFATGEALRKNERSEEAQPDYRWIVEHRPDCEWADDSLQTLAQLALEAGNFEEVHSLAGWFERRFADSPLLPLVRRSKGRALLKQRRFADAVLHFEHLVAVGASSPAESTQVTADDNANHYYLALAYLGDRRYERALAALEHLRPNERQPEMQRGTLVAQASALVGLQRFQEATAPLQAYLQADPDGPDAPRCRAQLTVAMAALGQFDEAVGQFAEFRQRHPDHRLLTPTAEYAAEAAYAKGEHQRAREFFKQLAGDEQPGSPRVAGLSGLAWTELQNGNFARAEELFGQLLAEDPENTEAPQWALLRAQTLAKLDQHEKALAAYRAVGERYPESNLASAGLFEAARLHEQRQQLEQAASTWKEYIDRYPESPETDGALYSWAWALVDLGRGDEADAVFERLHKDHRDSQYWGDAVYRLAERAARDQHHSRAARLVDELIVSTAGGSVRSRALYLKGQVAAAQERWEEVAEPMRRLLDEHPNDALVIPAQYWLAESAYRLAQFDDAAALFSKLAAAAEGRQETWVAMIPLRQAQILAQQRRWGEAQEIAARIEKRFPDFQQRYEVDYLLARSYAAQARFDDARTAYQRVIQSSTGGATETAAMAQWMIGETYLLQKRYGDAIKAYRRVEQLFDYPRWQAAALLQTGKCREKTSRFSDAVQVYKRLLEVYPDSEFAAEATQRLRFVQQRADDTSQPGAAQ